MKAVNKYQWVNDNVLDNNTQDVYEYESIELHVNSNGELVATSFFERGGIAISSSNWKVKGFFSYTKDFAEFKIETIAK